MAKQSLFGKPKEKDILPEKKEKKPKGGYKFPSYQFSGSMTKQMKRVLSMRFFKFEKDFAHLISHAPARSYGIIFIAFGLLSLILHYVGFYTQSSGVTPVIAIIFTILSLPFLLTDKSLSVAMQDNAVTDFIFFEFFAMRRVSRTEKAKKIPVTVTILIGFFLAVLGRFLPTWQIIVGAAVVVFVYMSFASPEFAFFTSFILMPYSNYIPRAEIVLPCLVALTFLSFIRKVLYGKRVINVEKYDIVIILLGAFILVSGIFVKGMESFSQSVQMLAMSLGYFLASNVITNRRLAERTLNSLIISSTIPAIISIVQIIVKVIEKQGTYLTKSDLDSIFVRADGLAVFLIVAIVLSVSMAKHSSGFTRGAYVICMSLNLVALIISGEVFAIVAVIISALAYYTLKSNKLVGIRLVILLVLPLGFLLLPESYLGALFSLSSSALNSFEELVSLWRASLDAFLGSPLVGIGMGADSFAFEMASHGIFGHPDSANLFIELGLEAGIFALGSFLILLFIRLRHRRGYFLYVRSSQLSSISLVSGACLFAMLTFGMLNYIWSDVSAYYVFWTVFGIGSATMRVAKQEHDDLVFYYEDIMAVDSSVIDVEIG